MKTMSIALLILGIASTLLAQEETSDDWRIMPSVTVVKFFPGRNIGRMSDVYMPTYPPMIQSYTEYNYAGTGINFSARCFSDEFKPLAFTFSGGISWYYQPEQVYYPLTGPAQSGVGVALGRQDFTAFPVSIGVQAVFPYASREKLMFFAGAEGNLHFISGSIAMSEQVKAGYTVVGGFAVKIFEFGIRYTSFSDISNLGVHFGVRFNSFGV
jgi:hypothetical protein